MATAVTRPTVDEVFDAAFAGDVAIVEQFLEGGGQVDQGLLSPRWNDEHSFDYPLGMTLLTAAAESGHVNVMKLLLAHYADTNVTTGDGYTALLSAVVFGKPDAVQLLLDSDVDTSTCLSHAEFANKIIEYPRIVRILLVAGVDLTANSFKAHGFAFPGRSIWTLEDLAKESITKMRHPGRYPRLKEAYTETATVLEGTRLAGHSYKHWVLGPYKKLLRLRSQVARGYATIGPETPPVVARLFGLPGVPDPCFWLVVEYAWLGDWRRP